MISLFVMQAHLFKVIKATAMLVLPTLFLTSCFEQSIVVKVNKDGSGIVHERSYMNDAMGGMLGGMLGGEEGDPNVNVESSGPDIPSEDELKEVATGMGEGVTFKSVQAGKNKAGWSGYEVVYEFTDINKVKLDMETLGGAMGPDAEEIAEVAAGEDTDAVMIEFEMADGVLKILTPDPSGSLADAGGGGPGGEGGAEGGAENPFGDLDPNDPESAMAMQMMGPMFAGMRMGFFVQGGDPIASTNAKHQNGNLITLVMMDMGKVFQNPANLAALSVMENETDRAKLQELIDGIDGITADLQEPITITYE